MGFGLSYSKFEYANLKTDRSVFNTDSSPLKVTCTVRNLGPYDGEEVVQLYVKDRVGSVTRPVRELKGFQKIFLKNGESKTLTFTLTADDLKFYNRDMIWTAEPGMFDLYVGADSNAPLTTSVELR